MEIRSVASSISRLAATRVRGLVRLPDHDDQCRQGPRDCQQSCLHLPAGILPGGLKQAGQQVDYPAPPLQLTDELNLKLMQQVRAETEKAETGAGKLATEHTAYPVIDTLVEAGRPGRLEKAGFYDYDEDGKRIAPWEGLRDTFKASPAIRRHQPDRRASPDNRDRGHDSARSRRVSQLTRTAKLLPIHCPRVRAPNPQ